MSENYTFGTTPLAVSTPRQLLVKQLRALNSGSATGQAQQVYTYSGSSPSFVPANTSQPAIAYDPTGANPTFNWNPNTQSWN